MSDRPMHTVPGLMERLQALYTQGEQAMAERRFDDAVALYTEGIELDDHFRQRWVTMYAQRAFALHNLRRLEEAAADYARAIAMGEPPPHCAQYHFQRGMCLADLGRTDDALAAYDAAVELAPEQPGPRHLRGKLLASHLNRPADALADFDAFRQQHDHPEVRQLRAWCLLQLGRAAEALADLDVAAARFSDAWTAYLVAWASAATGDLDRCVGAIGDTVARDPGYRSYFLELDDYAAARAHPGFAAAVGAG